MASLGQKTSSSWSARERIVALDVLVDTNQTTCLLGCLLFVLGGGLACLPTMTRRDLRHVPKAQSGSHRHAQ